MCSHTFNNYISESFILRMKHRIHSLISLYSKGFEDLIYLYYSQSFKIFNLLSYHVIYNIKKMKESVDKDYQLSKEECVLFVIPELNNFEVCVDTWDKSEFYTEYLNEVEEDVDDIEDYNDINMIYEDDEIMINGDNSKEICSPSSNREEDEENMITEKIEKNHPEMNDIEMKNQDFDEEEKEEEEEKNNNNNDDTSSDSTSSMSESETEDEELEYVEEEDYDNDSDIDISNHEMFYDEDNLTKAKNSIRQFVINSSYTIEDNYLYRYEYIISNVIYRYVRIHIYNNYKGIFNEPFLVRSINWLNCVTIPFQRLIWQPERKFLLLYH